MSRDKDRWRPVAIIVILFLTVLAVALHTRVQDASADVAPCPISRAVCYR